METTLASAIATPPIQLTPSALVELKRLAQVEKVLESGQGLRLGVKGGGCSGLSYILEFGKQEASDLSFDLDGLPLYINKAQSLYLQGCELDFDTGLNNRGFVFTNPNAKSSCGCGSSFAV